MTTKIKLFDEWLLERGSVSLQAQSFRDNINSKGLSDTAHYLRIPAI